MCVYLTKFPIIIRFSILIIYKPLTYLLPETDCLRGLTIIGKIITPAVKTQIGATTISMDSKDIIFYKLP